MTAADDTNSAAAGGRARVAVAIAFGVAIALLAVTLGQWQTRRGDAKQALQAQWDAANSAPAMAVAGPSDALSVVAQLPRRVQVRGAFDALGTVFVGNRMHGAAAGFYVLAPLRLSDGLVVLVNRGWIARDARDPALLPPVATPAAEVVVEGLAVARVPRILELAEVARAVPPAIWPNLTPDEYAKSTGAKVLPFVVQQTSAADDGLKRDWPRVDTGVQKHRGYALQWYALAALAAGLTVFFGGRALRSGAHRTGA